MPEITRKPLSWFKTKPQVRKVFDEASLRLLGVSLKRRQLQAVLAQPDGTIVEGERRLRAAQMAGLDSLQVTIVDGPLSDSENKLCQLTAAMQREDLTGYEKWLACTEILSMNLDWDGKDLAEHLSLDPSSITRILSASKTIAPVQDAFKEGAVSASDVYAISKMPPDKQAGLLALKLSGMGRDALEEEGRRVRARSKPSVKVSRAKLILASGVNIVVSGAAICLDTIIQALGDAGREARKAREQHQDVKALVLTLANKSKAKVT